MIGALRTGLVVLVALVVQLLVVAPIPVVGVTGDAMLLISVVAGSFNGPTRGAIVGFAAGIVLDTLLQGPFGLSALVFALTGYAVGSVQAAVLGSAWWLPMVASGAAATTATAVYAGLGALLGNPEWIEPELVKIAVVVGLLAALFSPIALPIMAWTDGQPLGVRSSIGRRSPSRGRAGHRPGVLRY